MSYAFFHVLGCSPLVILEILEYRKMQNMYPCRIRIQNLWSSRRVQGYCCTLELRLYSKRYVGHGSLCSMELTLNLPSLQVHSSLLAKFVVPDWGDKVDSDIGLSYRPASLCSVAGRYDNTMPESTISPSQGLWIWVQLTAPITKGRGWAGERSSLICWALGYNDFDLEPQTISIST